MGTLCLDFVPYVKQDPFALRVYLFRFRALYASKSLSGASRTLEGVWSFIVPGTVAGGLVLALLVAARSG